MEKSFLIIGAGEVGLAMLNSLYDYQEKYELELQIGVLVQPLANSIAKAKSNPRFVNITVETLDLVNQSTSDLITVFKKYDTVICCSGFSTGKGMQVKITRAVLEAGVKRYVPWQFGVDYDKIGRGSAQPSFDEQLEVRELLRAQHNTHWIIVSTGMITSFLFREDFGVISLSDKTVHALGDWQHSLTLTSCEDIGNLTIDILFHKPEILDQVVFVAGDTLTFDEIFNQLNELFAKEFDRKLWDIPQMEKEVKDNPDNVFNRYRFVFTHPGVTWPISETFNYQNNIPTVDLKHWVINNISDVL
nr:aromatic alcohol reductase [Pedobacter panaciterrae]